MGLLLKVVHSPKNGRATWRRRALLAAALAVGTVWVGPATFAQPAPAPAPAPATAPSSAVPAELVGKPVEEVRIVGRQRPLSSIALAEIRRQIRTREGDKFDPTTVREDYQRIYALRRFGNVEARIEPTATGVVVVFEVAEQDLIRSIAFKGNKNVDATDLTAVVDLRVNEAVDAFRLASARDAIEKVYRSKNYPFAHVNIPQEPLQREGAVVFTIVEGPHVRVRNVEFKGNVSFTDGKLDDVVKTASWFPIFRSGTYDAEQIDQDVAALRQFYEDHGFFDARVGRTIAFSADQTEVQVNFLIEEGKRYQVDRVLFKGNTSIPEEKLRAELKMTAGRTFDRDLLRRDVRQIVREYSPLGFVYYQPPGMPPNPDYLQIRPREVFHREAGKVDIVYDINEGKPFRMGRVLISGNDKTQDKVLIRELRVAPGDLYNSSALQEGVDRIRGLNYFSDVRLTPIGDSPTERDVLIEVTEQSTSRIMLGAAVSSASGVMGNITFEQRNFDISAVPTRFSDITEGRAFVGAGQFFRINLEPGTQVSRATIDFVEPWVFDQPYSFGANIYYQDRRRESWTETRLGTRLFVGKRFLPYWSARITFRGEDLQIRNIDDELDRAPEIVQAQGHNTITSFGAEVKRDSTDSPILPSKGSIFSAAWEYAGAFGGDFTFHKFTVGYDQFFTVSEDLLDRKTTLSLRADGGYIAGAAPFFERFYAGDRNSIRGFRYRGVSPRAGVSEDPIGGNLMLTGTVELNYPIYSDVLRGVVFVDAGTVEKGFEITTIRSSVGVGIRWTLPFLGQVPLAFDLAVPITRSDQDDLRIFSFSLGVVR